MVSGTLVFGRSTKELQSLYQYLVRVLENRRKSNGEKETGITQQM